MNNIYEQYHVCVCWEKQNIHRNKLMNNAVISFLTFSTALGQLLNFDLTCASAFHPHHPLPGPQVHTVKFSQFSIYSSAEHKNPKSRRSSNLGVENQQRHILYVLKSRASPQILFFLWFWRSREVSCLEYRAPKADGMISILCGSHTLAEAGRLDVLVEHGWCGTAQGWHLIHHYVLSKYVERERDREKEPFYSSSESGMNF